MKLHTSIALGAVAALLAVPSVASADAGTVHAKHAKKAKRVAATATSAPEAGLSTTEQLQYAQQQLAQLQAQINDLQAKMSTPAKDNSADVKAAAAKADKALATAEKAQAAVAKTDKAVSAVKWASETTVGGRLYVNFSNITQHTNGGPNANTGTGVNLKRAYVTIDHKFSPIFAANLTLDAENVFGSTNTQNPSTASTSVVGKGLYVKNAYGEAKIDPKLIVRLGAAPLPWVPYSESNLGFRFVEKPLVDRVSFGTSADWGVHVLGDLYKTKDASLSYAVSAVNGAGYRQVKVSKAIDFEGRLSGTYKGLFAGVGGYVGKLGNAVQAVPAAQNTFRTAKRFDAIAGFKNDLFTIGGEYFYAKNWQNVTVNPATLPSGLSQDSAEGYSVFGNYNLSKKWAVFSHYDWVKPNKTTVPSLKDNYFVAGLQYSAVKNLDIALVYKRETVNGGALSTYNGTIGCSTSGTAHSFASPALASATCAGNGTYDEVGIFTQLRF